ncbi:MAG: diacylglycerol kinase family lipid kinase [Firmicutes bacterium]|nr:diacylglycerol kinase family lipid kinase [Bacillota bacterium]
MKHLFIINPVAGKGHSEKYKKDIQDYFKDKRDTYSIEITQSPGHATTLTKEYVRNSNWRVYSIGGDGTLNEVLNGLVGSGSSLGVIPSGSGNDFFRSLNSSNNIDILKNTIEGKETKCSLGKVNDRYFLNVASAGIDAEIVHNSRRFKKLPFLGGQGAYILGIFYTVFKYRSFKSKLTLNDQVYHNSTLLVAMANGRYYGGGMNIAPRADIFSKDFEVYHIDAAKPLRIIKLFPTLIKGKHDSLKEVKNYISNKVSLHCDDSFLLNVDGEIERVNTANFSLIEEGVNIIIPLV